ncbi:MAG TPA: hypothetical protein VFS43_38945 [Polyangiaceae bacterium]|nr:hypothetical protein [Polyangiaceae bacterium]
MRGAALGLALLLLGGCGSSSDGTGAAPAGSPSGAAAPAAGAASAAGSASAAAPAASADAPPLEGAPAAGAYAGSYKAKVGAMNEVPKEAKSKAWAGDAGTEAVGEGTLSLTVVSGRRAVAGEAKGPLGDQLINGELDGKILKARVDPADPNAPAAMTGILDGAFEGNGFKGVLRVSGRNGNLVREAAVTLTRK